MRLDAARDYPSNSGRRAPGVAGSRGSGLAPYRATMVIISDLPNEA